MSKLALALIASVFAVSAYASAMKVPRPLPAPATNVEVKANPIATPVEPPADVEPAVPAVSKVAQPPVQDKVNKAKQLSHNKSDAAKAAAKKASEVAPAK